MIKLHVAYRILAREIRASLPAGTLDAAREALVVLIERSLPAQWTVARFGLWLRLLTETGRIDTLIEVATREEFHQVGDPHELKSALEHAANDASLGVEERFWALDALIYWAQVRSEDDSRIATLTDEMSAMADAHVLSQRALAELRMKQMYASAVAGRPDKVRAAYEAGAVLVASDPSLQRLVRYNFANALYRLGAYTAASGIAFALVLDYYEHLNLDEEDVVATNPADILASVPDTPETTDDLRHTADCLYLLAACQRQLRRPVGLASLHAMKFYTAASAWRSGIQAGQDAVDQLIELGDPHGARHIAETFLLPAVSRYQLFDLLVPVRAQYAVVLAWCGEYEAARNELHVLEGYQLTPIGQQELADQRNLIEHLTTRPPIDSRPQQDPHGNPG